MKKREDKRIPVPSDVAKRLFEGMRAAVNSGGRLSISVRPFKRDSWSPRNTGNRVIWTVREGD